MPMHVLKSLKKYKVSQRLNIKVILVANTYQNIPCHDLIQLMLVKKEFDAADQLIEEQVEIHDIVIMADIPLSAKVLKKNYCSQYHFLIIIFFN